MTVNELVEELETWKRLGYGDAPVMLMNLNIDEYVEADEVNLIGSENGLSRKAIEVR